MTVAPEIEAAVAKIRSVAKRLRDDAEQLRLSLAEEQAFGADVRDLDVKTIDRFALTIPEALEKKASLLFFTTGGKVE